MSEASDNWIDRRGLAACLLIALVFRGLVAGLHADELTGDRDAYLGIAQGVADGRGLCSPGSSTPTAFRPPLYPVMLGCLMVAVPAGIAVAFVNGLFGVTAVWATHRIGQQLGLGRASLVAALLVAVDPLLMQYTAQPMTETACAGLVALLLLVMVTKGDRSICGSTGICGSTRAATEREPSPQMDLSPFVLGAVFGLLVLCRPTFWPFVGLLVVAWSVPRGRGSLIGEDGGQRVRPGHPRGLPWRAVVGTLLVVAPWVIRNQVVFGTPLLTTTHGGYTLLLANNSVFYDEVVDQPWGTVWSGDSLARWQSELEERLERDLGPGASEIVRDRRQNTIAREFIAAEPSRFARAVRHRVRSLWSTIPHGDVTGGPARWLVEAVGWYYSFTLLAFAAGMVVVARRSDRGRWWTLYALVVTVQAVHLVYWTNARMRAPLTPVLALFAAATLAPQPKPASPKFSTTAVGSGSS